MDYDLENLFPADAEPDPDAVPVPNLRATLRGQTLTVVAWAPYLLKGGPNGMLLKARAEDRVTIADLSIVESDRREIVVEYLCVHDQERADSALTRWAVAVGHGRIWLPNGPQDLPPVPRLGRADVTCPTCRAHWSDDSSEFWGQVRQAGQFPVACAICHGDLPQWRWRPTAKLAGKRSPARPSRPR